MIAKALLYFVATLGLVIPVCGAPARTIEFSGYKWEVRSNGKGGPGPNLWDESNVRVDENGHLHLKLTRKNEQWYASEVYLKDRLGFGRYQFWIIGRVDQLDPNVVLGLFNYPRPDIGPDGTHEIDIEFAKWGKASNPIGNYTVWPVTKKFKQQSKLFPITMSGDRSTHRFTWSSTNIVFQSLHGHYDDNTNEYSSWRFEPADPSNQIAQKPMPIQINLWCFQGRPPTDGKEVEIVVRAFEFKPLEAPKKQEAK